MVHRRLLCSHGGVGHTPRVSWSGPPVNRFDLIEKKLLDVYSGRAKAYQELDACYTREYAKGCMTYEHIQELSQEVEEAFNSSEATLDHLIRNNHANNAQAALIALRKLCTPSPRLTPECSRKKSRSLLEQHSPPNLARHLSSTAPPRPFGTSNLGGYLPAHSKGNSRTT